MMIINEIHPQKVDCYDPEGNWMGKANEFEFDNLRIQIAEADASGYYIVFEGKRYDISSNGELFNWPYGLFDLTQKQYIELIKIRQIKALKKAELRDPYKQKEDLSKEDADELHKIIMDNKIQPLDSVESSLSMYDIYEINGEEYHLYYYKDSSEFIGISKIVQSPK